MQKVFKYLRSLFKWRSSTKYDPSSEYFVSIDTLCADSYFKIHQTGNHALLSIKEVKELEPNEVTNEIWHNINDEKIEAFGLPTDQEKYIILLKKFADKLADTIILEGAGQRKAEMFLKMAEADLKAFLESESGVTLDETIDMLEQKRGYDIDMTQISTRKFFARLENLKKGNGKN